MIPLLETLNPAARENIAQSARYLRQAKMMLDDAVEVLSQPDDSSTSQPDDSSNIITIDKQLVMQAASPEFVLHQLIGCYGFHGDTIDGIIESMNSQDGGIGKIWKSNEYMLCIDREKLFITPLKEMDNLQKERAFRLPEEGNYSLAGNTRIRIRRYPRTADFTPSKESHRITLDADQVSFPLTYRLTQQGDRFKPFGMKGTKLVSDYLTDRKRNYMEKMSQHVLTDKAGEIIWLIGERTSDHCRITPNTQSILEIELEENPEV